MIVLGIDGMDPVFLETHWQSLPNLNQLRTEGDFRRLGTTIPPQSPVAWSTVTTGMDPGGHGIFDFIHRNPATRLPMSSMAEITEPTRTIAIGPYLLPLAGGGIRQTRAGRAFWQILAEHGVHSNIVRMYAVLGQDLPEGTAGAGLADAASGEREQVGTDGDRPGGLGDFRHGGHGQAGGRIAVDKIENAVAAGVHSSGDGGPCYRALRRNSSAQAAEITLGPQLVQVGQRLPMGFEKDRVHAVDSQHDHARAGRMGGLMRAAREQQRQARQPKPTNQAATSLSKGCSPEPNSGLPSI